MKFLPKRASLLRGLVEPVPADGLGALKPWTWQPTVTVDPMVISGGSPTTEYSSNEDNE